MWASVFYDLVGGFCWEEFDTDYADDADLKSGVLTAKAERQAERQGRGSGEKMSLELRGIRLAFSSLICLSACLSAFAVKFCSADELSIDVNAVFKLNRRPLRLALAKRPGHVELVTLAI